MYMLRAYKQLLTILLTTVHLLTGRKVSTHRSTFEITWSAPETVIFHYDGRQFWNLFKDGQFTTFLTIQLPLILFFPPPGNEVKLHSSFYWPVWGYVEDWVGLVVLNCPMWLFLIIFFIRASQRSASATKQSHGAICNNVLTFFSTSLSCLCSDSMLSMAILRVTGLPSTISEYCNWEFEATKRHWSLK